MNRKSLLCAPILVLAAFAVRAPAAPAFSGAALFGAAHGIAHGAGMPRDGSGLTHALGFLRATAASQALGVVGGLAARRLDPGRGARVAAALSALAGVGILATS